MIFKKLRQRKGRRYMCFFKTQQQNVFPVFLPPGQKRSPGAGRGGVGRLESKVHAGQCALSTGFILKLVG